MVRWDTFLVMITGGVAVVVAGLYAIGVAFPLCANTQAKTAFSPDKAYKVILFERDCGATTAFSTQVSVLPADSNLPNDGGNVFVADLKGDGPRGAWGGPDVQLKWLGNRQLEIRYDHSARTFEREPASYGIEIHYVVTQ